MSNPVLAALFMFQLATKYLAFVLPHYWIEYIIKKEFTFADLISSVALTN